MNESDIISPFEDIPKVSTGRYLIQNEIEEYTPFLDSEKELYAQESIIETPDEFSDAETEQYSGLDSFETTGIMEETPAVPQTCEGLYCWAKSVLNKHYNLNLRVNNTLDDQTKKAIAEFQLKNNLPVTNRIDSVTERALLEADALVKSRGTSSEAAAVKIISEAKTNIEDWTKKAVVDKPEITNNYRDPRKLWAFVLHHMAFKRQNRSGKLSDPNSYLRTGAHFCIMLDGRIIQLHSFSRFIWHAQCISPRSVSVEFEGNFPNIKGKWWIDKKSKFQNKDVPTQAQYDSGRFLVQYLKTVLGTTHILAHRQSADSRENDPGPDIWYNVGQWAIDNLGLTDGGPAFKCGTGSPILPEWRTWGDKTKALISKGEIINEADWEEKTDADLALEENEDYGHQNFNTEMDELLTDRSKAVRLNRYFQNKLDWAQYYDKINDLLLPFSGLQKVSLGEEAFAEAVSAWQSKQGFSAKDCDGIIGPNTWEKMKPFIAGHPSAPVVQSSGMPSQSMLGKLTIDTTINALSKSYPEYQFTPDDALWLARFVEGEAGGQNNPDSHAVIWAMFNRFGILRHRVPAWTSLAVFLQKYSTTLQPLLNSPGAAERVWDNYKRNPAQNPVVSSEETYPGTKIKKVQYLRHIKLQKKSWNEFAPHVREMVLDILTGKIPNPGIGIATHFLSTYILLKTKMMKQGINVNPSHEEWRRYTMQYAQVKNLIWIDEKQNINQKKNAFFIQPEFKNVNPAAVKIEFTGHKNGEILNDLEYHEAIELSEIEGFDNQLYDTLREESTPVIDQYTLAYKLDKLRDWVYLLSYKVPDQITAKLKERSMYVKYAHNESYSNDLNVDFYRLKIDKYPTINGVLLTPESLTRYIRLNFNSLIDTSYCDFYPYDLVIDTVKWYSNDPTGTVLKLDIKGPDNAAVVVSLAKPTGWRFSTVYSPLTGHHPVSGHREFFIALDSVTRASYFVVKGLDMLSTGVAGLGLPIFGEFGYRQGDLLWKSLMDKLKQFIDSNGGQASKDIIYSERVEWRYVYYRYKNLLEQTFGKGAGSAENSGFFN